MPIDICPTEWCRWVKIQGEPACKNCGHVWEEIRVDSIGSVDKVCIVAEYVPCAGCNKLTKVMPPYPLNEQQCDACSKDVLDMKEEGTL